MDITTLQKIIKKQWKWLDDINARRGKAAP
jgi:hypothetical protein